MRRDAEEDEPDYGATQDSFIARDDKVENGEDDDFEFETMDQDATHSFGPPITSDSRMSKVHAIHRDVIDTFVAKAKKLEEQIRNKENLRKSFFTETNFQEMARTWTLTLDEMRHIPQIDIARVDKYGRKFLPLIKWHYDFYNDSMNQKVQSAGGRDMDRNHENVVVVVSDDDDDEEGLAEGEDIDEDDEYGAFDENEESMLAAAETTSTYFNKGKGKAFPNSGAGGSSRPWQENKSQAGSSRAPARGGKTFRARGRGRGAKKAYSRKSSSGTGTSGRTNSGVKKPRGGTSSGGRSSGGASEFVKRFSHSGGRGGGGIGMMPT